MEEWLTRDRIMGSLHDSTVVKRLLTILELTLKQCADVSGIKYGNLGCAGNAWTVRPRV